MKYAILIYDENTVNPPANPDPEIMAKVFGEYQAFTDEINAMGINKGGEALQPNQTATTVRVRDGKTVTTDGPFAETKEGLGGFYIIDVEDLDAALAVAARCPASWYGTVEVRPVQEFEAYEDSNTRRADA